ncbi:MAG: hypothetical protein V9F82_02785 [Dermatophilaceae bacterium]
MTVPRLASEEYSETRMLMLGSSAPIHSPAKARATSSIGRLGARAVALIPTTMRDRHMRMCRRRPMTSAKGEMRMPPAARPMDPALRKYPVWTLVRPHTSGLARNGAT